MISVPNLLQPSNGNKWLLILLVVFILSSCDLFKKAQDSKVNSKKQNPELEELTGKRVYDPETGTIVTADEVPVETMDTVKWKEVSASNYPPITSEGVVSGSGGLIERQGIGDYGTNYLTSYNVALMLPFVTNRFDSESGNIDQASEWALQYYGGTKMALDKLSEENIKLNVEVMDTEGNTRKVSTLLRNEAMTKKHLIIGPYRGENVDLLASFVQRNDMALVSPHFVPQRDDQGNPNYVQVNPSLKSHCEALVRHARKYYSTQQITVVARNDGQELQALQYLQAANVALSGGRDTSKFQEYIVSGNFGGDDANIDYINAIPFITLTDTTVFIVPSWSDEKFIQAFLRKVDVSKRSDNYIVVYGMPQWTKFERVEFEYFEKLNVHVSSNFYLNPLSEDVQQFKRSFFERYGVIPKEEAFVGYDLMLYFGRMLKQHGTKFQYFLDSSPDSYLHTRFEFEKVVIPTTTGRENLPAQKFENKFLNILKFQDFQFQPVY